MKRLDQLQTYVFQESRGDRLKAEDKILFNGYVCIIVSMIKVFLGTFQLFCLSDYYIFIYVSTQFKQQDTFLALPLPFFNWFMI